MIIGHNKQLRYLGRLIKSGRTPHALIFSGPQYIGKKTAAFAFFSELSSLDKVKNHPDVLLIERGEEKQNISIDQTRQLKKFASLSPMELKKKLILIDDAHLLSVEAVNSLLKVLEEPSESTLIILVTDRALTLPNTILSRSITVNFQPLNQKDMRQYVKENKLNIKEEDLAWLAGRPGLALAYAQDPRSRPASTLKNHFFSFLKILSQESLAEKFELAKKAYDETESAEVLEAWILAVNYRMKQEGNVNLALLLEKLKNTREIILRANVNKRLWLEELLISV